MGLVKSTGSTDEMRVYLTDLGRKRLLEQGFEPVSFSISDQDANYIASQIIVQIEPDLTGDYDDNVYSLSKNIKLKNNIII